MTVTATVDEDARLLGALGYKQELRRVLGLTGNFVIGFATISPVVALYGVLQVGTTLAGPAWIWALPICLIGQCSLLVVYSELGRRFPLSGGIYQWSRRLVGPAYGWFTGWLAICGYLTANTTIAYLAAPWILDLVGQPDTAGRRVVVGVAFIVVCSVVNGAGMRVTRLVLGFGVAAEIIATVVVGLDLLAQHRIQPLSLLTTPVDAGQLSGGSVTAFIAAIAVGGWVFIGFDACVGASEETRNATRNVPRALWCAIVAVALVVILNAAAILLAHPRPGDVVSGVDTDPVTTAVSTAYGAWSSGPFTAMTAVAFLSCGIAAQALTSRTIFSIARDGVLPASAFLRRLNKQKSPIGAILVSAIVGCAGLTLGLDGAAMGSLIAFGTALIYLVFLLVAAGALRWRLRSARRTAATGRSRALTAVNIVAVVWLLFEFINISWPRESLAPPGAPVFQVYAALIISGISVVVGAVYLAIAKPHLRQRQTDPMPSRRV